MKVGSISAKVFNIFFKKEVFFLVKTSGLRWALLQCWVPHDVNYSTGELN